MKRRVFFLPLILIGCTVPATTIDVPGINLSDSVVVKDQRPPTEKEKECFSYSISNDAYAIYRKGDDVSVPSPIRLFQHRVFEKLKSSNTPIEIKINHFVVYWNAQAQLKRGALGAAGGVIGAVLASGSTNTKAAPGSATIDRKVFDSLAGEEYKRALYTASENPNNASVYIVYIDAEINGKSNFIRTMTPSTSNDNKNQLITAIESGIEFYLSAY